MKLFEQLGSFTGNKRRCFYTYINYTLYLYTIIHCLYGYWTLLLGAKYS